MKRGIAVFLVCAAALTGTPVAGAAPTPQPVVYEVVRTPKAPATGRVRIEDVPGGDAEAVVMYANVEPPGSEAPYRSAGMSATADGWSGWTDTEVDLSGGRRFVVGGLRGRFRVVPKVPGWTVREAGRGFRVVSADPASKHAAGPVGYEHFTGVTAPGGQYGSIALGSVPCSAGAGTWTFANDVEPWTGPPNVCAVDSFASEWGDARGRVTWQLDGDVTGVNGWPYDVLEYRLVVLDLPRPAARR
jgi:hypothetical protein